MYTRMKGTLTTEVRSGTGLTSWTSYKFLRASLLKTVVLEKTSKTQKRFSSICACFYETMTLKSHKAKHSATSCIYWEKISRRDVLFYKDWSPFVLYTRSGSETVAVSIWDLMYRGKNANLSSRGCSPSLAAAWSPLRVDLVRCVPAPLHSSQCAARRHPGCLFASTKSAARRRSPMPGILYLPTARVPVRRPLFVAA
jgi:hypothetical protein